MALSFAMPWYEDGDKSYRITNGLSIYDSFGRPIETVRFVLEALVAGVFFWWVFMATSVLKPSRLRAAVGWLAVALVAVSLATVGMHTGSPQSGWLLGVFALVLLGVSVVSDMNRAFFLEKKDEGPFASE